MEMSEQDAFKLGFLTRCAEEKLTGDALNARLEKISQFTKKAVGLPGVPSLDDLKNLTLGYVAAMTLPFGASILGGSALGYGAGKMVEPEIDEDEIRSRELADTYKLYADKAKSRRKAVKYRATAGDTTQKSFDDVYSRV